MKHVYLIGSKGIPAHYGGFETFVERLTALKQSKDIMYHVACLKEAPEPHHNGADCFAVRVPEIGPAKAILYDRKAFLKALKEIRKNREEAVIYVLACRLGPFMTGLVIKAHLLNVPVYINPDGHEWMRKKWSGPVRAYWKASEKNMVKMADLCICDALEMERYIKEEYAAFQPKTCYLSYGADQNTDISAETEAAYRKWLSEHDLKAGDYALIVGRFVPENNYLLMLAEYCTAETDHPLCIITDYEGKPFYDKLLQETQFDTDERIRFVGTVYDRGLLALIRRNAWVYIHGHEVGGTNPSLLEALAETEVNLLLDVPFNREVGQDAALYFTKEPGNLAVILDMIELYDEDNRHALGQHAKQRIREAYRWEDIVAKYEALWEKGL